MYTELAAATNFSFLRGASHAVDMVGEAIALGHSGIGIADRNTVAGVVRAHEALKDARAKLCEAGLADIDFKLIVGARLVFSDGTPDVIAYPTTRAGWGRLCRLLTTGNLRAKKGECDLRFDDLVEWAGDMVFVVMARPVARRLTSKVVPLHPLSVIPAKAGTHLLPHVREMGPRFRGDDEIGKLRALAAICPTWIGATMLRGGRDKRRLAALRTVSTDTGVPLVAVNDALYATPADRPLHDIATCIREGTTIAEAGTRLEANAERHLKSPAEMARLFGDAPGAIAATQDVLNRVNFSLDQLRYEYPHEPVPAGWDPHDWLEELTLSKARERYPDGIPARMHELLDEEFGLIRKLNYASYFLTVHDLVAFARSVDPPILCQGRGSAANSAVCYLLGITSVDPTRYNLLFSRFVSEERSEPPDIDVDFEHERREEVMQYVYRRYGRHRAGIVATVIHYRPRSAVREVGKALGLTEDVTTRLTSTVWGSYASTMDEKRFHETGFDIDNPEIARLNALVQRLLHFPRHLSQHVGGFVLTEGRLDEMVPVHWAAMEDRTFIEWDKDDIDALGLMKVDVLALGMLTCIQKSFELIATHLGKQYLLDTIPEDQPDVYDMLCAGDSVGVFQVESRAQMNMLPRLRPRELYDLVIQVAIVRPGPIQGDMVHPYLRRRQGREQVDYPSPHRDHGPPDELIRVLGKTLGVPLFQEQAMQLCIAAAKFTPGEANLLRRAMATFRNVGRMDRFYDKMVGGMVARGYERDFAERCYQQIQGFGSYGFPESHALSFARLVYVSSYIKCRYPAVFCAALLNSQPMGFYAPAQIVRCAREHGVEVRAIDVNASGWDNGIEVEAQPEDYRHPELVSGSTPGLSKASRAEGWMLKQVQHDEDSEVAVRLGLRQIDGFREEWATAIAANTPYALIEDLARRAALPPRALRLLADADALRSLGTDRREALWEVRRTPCDELPLFAAADARELGEEAAANLPAMALGEHVAADYQTIRLSLKAHPMAFLRDLFAAEGVSTCAQIGAAKNGARIKAAGVVLIRQRPGNGNAIFVTIEDETGIGNLVIWARTFEAQRVQVMAARLMVVEGEVQKSPEGVIHLMVSRIHDRTIELGRLSETHVAEQELSRSDAFERPLHVKIEPLEMPWRCGGKLPEGALPAGGRHPRDVRILPKSRDFH